MSLPESAAAWSISDAEVDPVVEPIIVRQVLALQWKWHPLESLDNVEMDTAYSPDALIECLGSLLEKCNPKVCQPQSTELCNCLKYYCHAQTTEKCASTMLSRNEPSSSFGGTVEMIYFLWN